MAKSAQNGKILEIGTHYGFTTRNLRTIYPNAQIVTVDLAREHCPDGLKHQQHELLPMDEIGREYQGLDNAQILQFYGGSDDFFKGLDPSESFDFIFVDGDHAYEQVKKDTENAMRFLAPGGVIAWHDVYNKDRWPCQKCGSEPDHDDVYEYLSQTDFEATKIGNSWVAFYVKPL